MQTEKTEALHKLKQSVSDKILSASTILEFLLAIVLFFGIILGTIRIIQSNIELLQSGSSLLGAFNCSKFLADIMQLVIGIEFIKMLCKHTPSSTIDVLLFTIARSIIVYHPNSWDLLLAVVSMALLFAVRKFLYHKITIRKLKKTCTDNMPGLKKFDKMNFIKTDHDYGDNE